MEQNLGNGQNPAGINRCLHCNKPRNNGPHKKYCSHICYGLHKRGKPHSWGDKISKKLSGVAKTKEHVEKVRMALIGKKRPDISGEKNWNWKGDRASYSSLHDWVARQLGTPKECTVCKKTELKATYQWANVSGLYKRELSDWKRMCLQCHRKFDGNIPRASLLYEKRNHYHTSRIVGK